MHVNDLPKIFAACCGEDGRYNLSKPFAIKGHVYATDGRILVRMPVPKCGLQGGAVANLPGCDSVVGWCDAFREPIDIPEVPPAEMVRDEDGEEYEKFRTTLFGKMRLQNKYLRMLRENGAKLRLRKDRRITHAAVAFVGDGWDGLLMCCDPTAEDEA